MARKEKLRCPKCGAEIDPFEDWCGRMSTFVCPECHFPCSECILYEECWEEDQEDEEEWEGDEDDWEEEI